MDGCSGTHPQAPAFSSLSAGGSIPASLHICIVTHPVRRVKRTIPATSPATRALGPPTLILGTLDTSAHSADIQHRCMDKTQSPRRSDGRLSNRYEPSGPACANRDATRYSSDFSSRPKHHYQRVPDVLAALRASWPPRCAATPPISRGASPADLSADTCNGSRIIHTGSRLWRRRTRCSRHRAYSPQITMTLPPSETITNTAACFSSASCFPLRNVVHESDRAGESHLEELP